MIIRGIDTWIETCNFEFNMLNNKTQFIYKFFNPESKVLRQLLVRGLWATIKSHGRLNSWRCIMGTICKVRALQNMVLFMLILLTQTVVAMILIVHDLHCFANANVMFTITQEKIKSASKT